MKNGVLGILVRLRNFVSKKTTFVKGTKYLVLSNKILTYNKTNLTSLLEWTHIFRSQFKVDFRLERREYDI